MAMNSSAENDGKMVLSHEAEEEGGSVHQELTAASPFPVTDNEQVANKNSRDSSNETAVTEANDSIQPSQHTEGSVSGTSLDANSSICVRKETEETDECRGQENDGSIGERNILARNTPSSPARDAVREVIAAKEGGGGGTTKNDKSGCTVSQPTHTQLRPAMSRERAAIMASLRSAESGMAEGSNHNSESGVLHSLSGEKGSKEKEGVFSPNSKSRLSGASWSPSGQSPKSQGGNDDISAPEVTRLTSTASATSLRREKWESSYGQSIGRSCAAGLNSGEEKKDNSIHNNDSSRAGARSESTSTIGTRSLRREKWENSYGQSIGRSSVGTNLPDEEWNDNSSRSQRTVGFLPSGSERSTSNLGRASQRREKWENTYNQSIGRGSVGTNLPDEEWNDNSSRSQRTVGFLPSLSGSERSTSPRREKWENICGQSIGRNSAGLVVSDKETIVVGGIVGGRTPSPEGIVSDMEQLVVDKITAPEDKMDAGSKPDCERAENAMSDDGADPNPADSYPPGEQVLNTRHMRPPGAYSVPGRAMGYVVPDTTGYRSAPVENRGADMEGQDVHQEPSSSVAFGAEVVAHEGMTANGTMNREATVRQLILDRSPVVEGVAVERSAIDAGINQTTSGGKWTKRCHNRRQILLVAIVVIVALVATLVGVLVSSSSGGNSESNASSAASSPSTAPTSSLSPSASPTSEMFAKLLSHLQSMVSDQAVLEDPTTPQHKALMWLAYEDTWEDIDSDKDYHSNITERFALATLYFATGGESSWISPCNFLTEGHVCTWNGTDCGVFCGENDTLTVEKVNLSMNNLTGTLPDEIGLLSTIQSLHLWTNKLTGPLPMSIVNLLDLRFLYADANELEGPIPSSIGQLTNLVALWLNHNELTGSVPSSVNNLTQLKQVYLQANNLNGTIPFNVTSLSNLELLYIHWNDLTGTIPKSVFAANSSLLSFNFNYNSLTGTIPPEVGAATQLLDFQIGDNMISGQVPSDIAHLTNLEFLSLYSNELNGTIPSVIGTFENLWVLYLSRNQFTNTIPETLGNLSNLEHLHFHVNLFNGTIPTSFANLTSLSTLSFYNNSLSGNIDFLCNISAKYIRADCYDDPPEINCTCCQQCCSDYIQSEFEEFHYCFPTT